MVDELTEMTEDRRSSEEASGEIGEQEERTMSVIDGGILLVSRC